MVRSFLLVKYQCLKYHAAVKYEEKKNTQIFEPARKMKLKVYRALK